MEKICCAGNTMEVFTFKNFENTMGYDFEKLSSINIWADIYKGLSKKTLKNIFFQQKISYDFIHEKKFFEPSLGFFLLKTDFPCDKKIEHKNLLLSLTKTKKDSSRNSIFLLIFWKLFSNHPKLSLFISDSVFQRKNI